MLHAACVGKIGEPGDEAKREREREREREGMGGCVWGVYVCVCRGWWVGVEGYYVYGCVCHVCEYVLGKQ